MNTIKNNFWSTINKSLIPHKPGVYIYKNSAKIVIYVGKAIDLYYRVASYFTNNQHDSKTQKLVQEIYSLETIIVNSDIEALILEANLIKKYLPIYNIKLIDDKDYLYIKISNEDFPKIMTARKSDLLDDCLYFGPFPSANTVRQTLKKLRKIFPWCSGITKNRRPCFYFYLGLCAGSCVDQISKEEYKKIIKRFIKFLQGKTNEVVNDLQDEMKGYVNNLEFEKAEVVKKTLDGLQYLTQTRNIQIYLENPNYMEDQTNKSLQDLKDTLKLNHIPQRIECYDISNIQGKNAVGSLVVLTNGDIDKKWYRRFKIITTNKPNDVLMMEEVIRRRIKHQEWPKPDLILVDGGKPQVGSALKELKQGNWQVPVFGLAKKEDWLIKEDFSILKLARTSLSLKMLQKIRDEAHRFAHAYHQKLRANSFVV